MLDNGKWNAGKLLQGAVEILQRSHELRSVTYYKKDSFASPARPEMIARIAAENDAAVTADGD